MKYETSAGLPTVGLTYQKLLDHLAEAQECAALLAHLRNAEGSIPDRAVAMGWLTITEQLRRMQFIVTKLAIDRAQ